MFSIMAFKKKLYFNINISTLAIMCYHLELTDY
jgi:hypothetical protein